MNQVALALNRAFQTVHVYRLPLDKSGTDEGMGIRGYEPVPQAKTENSPKAQAVVSSKGATPAGVQKPGGKPTDLKGPGIMRRNP